MELQQIVCRRRWEFFSLSLSSVRVSHSRLTLIDSPEVAPGSTPGPSSPSSPPTSPSNSGLKAWLIAIVIVGVATISFLIVALFFYRRRHRSLTSFAALPAAESVGDSLSAHVAFNQAFNTPILSPIPSQASSRTNPYTVFPVPSPQPY